jgi:Short C-terminal domain/Domain of unknwon function (DUF3824)
MPGLIRGVARTAVVAGTATAVSGRVQRRQAEKYTQRDANIAAERTEAYQEQVYADQPPQQQYTPPPPAAPDPIEQLKQLGELHASGVLTDEEFAQQKAKILGS